MTPEAPSVWASMFEYHELYRQFRAMRANQPRPGAFEPSDRRVLGTFSILDGQRPREAAAIQQDLTRLMAH